MRALLPLIASFAASLALTQSAVAQPPVTQPPVTQPPVAQPPVAGQAENPAADAALAKVLGDPRRADDRARDQWRRPAETLSFFRVQPGQTVVDYTPGGGWWTRVLAPYVGDKGHYIALNPDVRNVPEMAKFYADTASKFPPRALGWTGLAADRISAYNTDGLPAGLNGTVDRVLVFRAVHNLFRNGMLTRELTAIRSLLKPDGLLGIEQHRARADAPAAYTDGSKGYLREKDVIALVEAHGFELVAKSEINANAKDTADYPGGVWTLPPSLDVEGDKARYQAIGESDRMTLLFRKRS